MKYMQISCGCAECGTEEPLMEISGPFDTIEEAKESSWIKNREWKDHPQGGVYVRSGQGDDWVLPMPEGLIVKKETKKASVEEQIERFNESREAWTDGQISFDSRFPTVESFIREFGE